MRACPPPGSLAPPSASSRASSSSPSAPSSLTPSWSDRYPSSTTKPSARSSSSSPARASLASLSLHACGVERAPHRTALAPNRAAGLAPSLPAPAPPLPTHLEVGALWLLLPLGPRVHLVVAQGVAPQRPAGAHHPAARTQGTQSTPPHTRASGPNLQPARRRRSLGGRAHRPVAPRAQCHAPAAAPRAVVGRPLVLLEPEQLAPEELHRRGLVALAPQRHAALVQRGDGAGAARPRRRRACATHTQTHPAHAHARHFLSGSRAPAPWKTREQRLASGPFLPPRAHL